MNILVTGGASGLGAAISLKLLALADAQVWFTYHASSAAANTLVEKYPNAHAIPCDFRSSEDVLRLQSAIADIELDALVNNALPLRFTRNHFHRLDLAAFRAGFLANVLPTIAVTQEAIRQFRKRHNGRIVTILSSAIVGKPPAGFSEYAATKAYLLQLAKSWAVENAPFGITSVCISPAYMPTPLNERDDKRIVDDMVSRHPLKRLLTANEVADAVAFLLAASPHINGINLAMNAATEMA